MTMVMVKMLKFLIILSLLQLINCSIDTDLHIDGLFPPDIDHDWRFNWNAFPTKYPISSKYIQRGELFPLDPPKKTNKIEPERKTFMDFASMLPIPNAEALMAASGVAMLQNVASASMPNIPKMVSSFFNIKNMFNNRNPNQLLPLLRSRAYKVTPSKTENDQEMTFGKREVSHMRKRNVTRRFKRPIVVAPVEQKPLEDEKSLKKTNKTKSLINKIPNSKELDSKERRTFVNSDFVGIPSPVGYKLQQKTPETNMINETKGERLSTKLPIKSTFVMKNPLETTVSSSYTPSNKSMFKSPPMMEDKFFTTTLRDLFQNQQNKEDNQKNNNKIVIITDDDLNDSKRTRTGRQRNRVSQNRPQPQALQSHKPPTELPVYIQEQRQMTGMQPPPIQIPNIFLGEEEKPENEIKPTYKNDIAETKICEHRKPKKVTPKPTKNPVHSSVMDIITNHAHEPQNMYPTNNWSYSPIPTSTKKPKIAKPPKMQKAVVSTSSPTSYMEMTNEFGSWYPQNNDQWSPNTPPFKQLPLTYSQEPNMDMVTGAGSPHPYYGSNIDDVNDDDDQEEEEEEEEDDMEFPAETKKVVRVMMPEVKFPNQKISQHQQFQLQSQQFQKKPPTLMNQYSGYPGATSNIEHQRYPSPHMMLNDGLLFQRYNLLKEIEQMQANLFGGQNEDESESIMGNSMSNSMMHSNQMISNPIMSSPLISSPVQSIPPSIPNSGPVLFSGNPAPGGTNMKSGTFTQKGKPMKLMKFRVL